VRERGVILEWFPSGYEQLVRVGGEEGCCRSARRSVLRYFQLKK